MSGNCGQKGGVAAENALTKAASAGNVKERRVNDDKHGSAVTRYVSAPADRSD